MGDYEQQEALKVFKAEEDKSVALTSRLPSSQSILIYLHGVETMDTGEYDISDAGYVRSVEPGVPMISAHLWGSGETRLRPSGGS